MVDPNKVFETAAGGSLTLVIKKLACLTIDQLSQLRGISGSIEWLKEELEILHAVLVDLSHDEHPTEQEKLWKNKMRELAYDIEDAIDSFTLASNNTPAQRRVQEAHQDPSFMDTIMETIQSCTDRIKRLPSDYGMATKIELLKQKLSSMEERYKRQKIGGNGDGPSHDSIAIRDVAQYASPADLVGTESPTNHIVRLLTEEAGSSARPRKVVVIVGFGGLGKTTLAKQVFDNIKGTFDLKAFVSVSRNPDLKTILLNILDSFGLGNDELHHLRQKNVERIIDKLEEYIGAKRYLVVVDDIWDEDAWTTLKAALFDNNCDSNIIVTTHDTQG